MSNEPPTETAGSRVRITDPARLEAALQWVDQVYPGRDRDGAAVVEMTWAEWRELRAALGLPAQPERKRKASGT